MLRGVWCGGRVISVCFFWKQESLEQEVKGFEERVSAIQQVLDDLKVQLYAKFGNNINLEAEESWAAKWIMTADPTRTFTQLSFQSRTDANKTNKWML